MDSDLLLGVVRSFRGFADALDEVRNARVFAGIHFRSACVDGQAVGVAVGDYVLAQALLPLGDDGDGTPAREPVRASAERVAVSRFTFARERAGGDRAGGSRRPRICQLQRGRSISTMSEFCRYRSKRICLPSGETSKLLISNLRDSDSSAGAGRPVARSRSRKFCSRKTPW